MVPPYRVLPIAQDVAWSVRATLRSPQSDYPAYVDVATGAGPCRVCLCPFEVGVDRAILFVYDPFVAHDPAPLPSPVHIHERGCAVDGEPEIGSALAVFPLTLHGYGPGRTPVVQQRPTGPEDVHDAIVRMLRQPGIEYLHLRNTDLGCFVCEVRRGHGDQRL